MVERLTPLPKQTKPEVKPTETPKIDPKNLGGLTQEEFDKVQDWFELEGKVDKLHLGS